MENLILRLENYRICGIFYDRLAEAIDLMREIVMTSDFTDAKRLYEILAEGKSRMQAQMTSGGHSVAAGRALSYGSIPGAVSEDKQDCRFYHERNHSGRTIRRIYKIRRLP